MSVIIFIHGEAAVGKSTLAERLSKDLRLPVISKDNFSEMLFNQIGTNYNVASLSSENGIFSTISLRTLAIVAEEFAISKQSIIIDAPFHGDILKSSLEHIANENDVSTLQIYCTANQEIRQQRYEARVLSGTRHPGHGDRLDHHIKAPSHPMLTIENTINVDMNRFEDREYSELVVAIRSRVEDEL